MADVKSMSTDEKLNVISMYAMTQGEADIAKIQSEVVPHLAKMAPQAEVDAQGLTEDIDKAYVAAAALLGADQTPSTPGTTTGAPAVTTSPASTITQTELNGLRSNLYKDQAQTQAISANTSIEQFILLTPDPSTYIPAGTKGIISKETIKAALDKYNGKVLPDDSEIASTTNFKALQTAAENGTPVDVHIPALNTKVYGYMAKLGSTSSSAQEVQQKTKDEFYAFVALMGAGYVTGAANKPACIIKTIESKPDKKHPGKMKPERSVLADRNKKEAIAAGNYVTIKAVIDEMAEANCKTALAFRIDTGKPNSNGSGNLIRTVRLTCKANIKKLETVDKFAEKFGSIGQGRNSALETPPTGNAFDAVVKAQARAIAELKAKAAEPRSVLDSTDGLAEKLKAFGDVTSTPAPTETPAV